MTQGVHSLEDSSALLWPTQYIFSEKRDFLFASDPV